MVGSEGNKSRCTRWRYRVHRRRPPPDGVAHPGADPETARDDPATANTGRSRAGQCSRWPAASWRSSQAVVALVRRAAKPQPYPRTASMHRVLGNILGIDVGTSRIAADCGRLAGRLGAPRRWPAAPPRRRRIDPDEVDGATTGERWAGGDEGHRVSRSSARVDSPRRRVGPGDSRPPWPFSSRVISSKNSVRSTACQGRFSRELVTAVCRAGSRDTDDAAICAVRSMAEGDDGHPPASDPRLLCGAK